MNLRDWVPRASRPNLVERELNDELSFLLAAWIPATHAARVDPMRTLRQE